MTDTNTREPTPAETAKLEAETAKLLADIETARAITRKAEAEADAAEHAATIASHAATKAGEDELARTRSDEHCRVYQFNGTVDQGSVDKCMAKLRLWDRIDPDCPIEVIFNSPGGGVIAGMALFDLLTRLSLRGGGSHHVTIGAQGYAASMAGILLQAGDTRWIGSQSYLMIHEISAGTGGKIGEMKDDVDFYDRICARVVGIFVARSDGKITKARFEKSWKRTDWWLLSDESLKLGFVDEVR
jgi:ATP-dependent protease ClpP protease subunit